jgi:hypothetical protein
MHKTAHLASELCGRERELEGRVEVVLLLMAAMHDLPLPHHQEPGVTCRAHADHHHPCQADQGTVKAENCFRISVNFQDLDSVIFMKIFMNYSQKVPVSFIKIVNFFRSIANFFAILMFKKA